MKQRAFVKYTKKGELIPGSLIITNGIYPSGGGLWEEVPVNWTEGTTTTTSTSTTTTTINPDTLCVSVPGWSTHNLNVTSYRNGDPIPEVTDPTQWANLTTGAWCWYNNDSANGTVYGRLYNWYAVNDPRGLAPIGYHIPTDAEWTTLSNCLGGSTIAGGKMKEAGTSHWNHPNTDATNSSGFTSLASGFRHDEFNNASFIGMGANLYYWSSTSSGTFSAFIRTLNYATGALTRTFFSKRGGLSVRVIAD